MRHSNLINSLGLVAVMSGLTACTGGGGSVTVTGSPSTGSTSLAVTTVYPSNEAESFATPKSGTRYHVKGLAVSVKGTCSRGVAQIAVSESGTEFDEKADCQNDGTFVWTRTFGSGEQGDQTLTVLAYSSAGEAMSGVTASVDVRVDNTAPAAPTLVFPASTPYTHSGSSGAITVQLSGAGDVEEMTGPASAELSFNGTEYEYATVLVDGSSTTMTFYAYDLAGNRSTGTDLQVDYTPSVSLLAAGTFLGGTVTDGGTSYSLDSTLSPMPLSSTDGGTSYILETGFNNIVQTLRP